MPPKVPLLNRDQIKSRILGFLVSAPGAQTREAVEKNLLAAGSFQNSVLKRALKDLQAQGHVAGRSFGVEGFKYSITSVPADGIAPVPDVAHIPPPPPPGADPVAGVEIPPNPADKALSEIAQEIAALEAETGVATVSPPPEKPAKAPRKPRAARKAKETPASQPGAPETVPAGTVRDGETIRDAATGAALDPETGEPVETPKKGRKPKKETAVALTLKKGGKSAKSKKPAKKAKKGKVGENGEKLTPSGKPAGDGERTSKIGCRPWVSETLASGDVISPATLIAAAVKKFGEKARWSAGNYIALAKKGKLKGCGMVKVTGDGLLVGKAGKTEKE